LTADGVKNLPSSSDKWREELKRLGQVLLVIALGFFALVAHIYNMDQHYKGAGVGAKEGEKEKRLAGGVWMLTRA